MRTQATFLSLLACCSVAHAQNLEPLINGVTNRDYFRLTFQDEFNGNALDTSKWTHTFTGKRWDATLVPEAVSVGNGNLTVKTWSELTSSGPRHYSGVISTNEKFSQAYGFYEARIDFDSAPGTWSAFWVHSWNMTGSVSGDLLDRPDLVGAEIDVIEHRSTDQGGNDFSSGGYHAVHWNGYGANQQANGTMSWATNLASGFHTFGLLWARDRYEFYIDGNRTWSFTNANAISSIEQFMILSTEVQGGGWAGQIPTAGYGTYANTTTMFKVDYVRAYAFNADSPFMPEPASITYFAALSAVCRRRR
jgi:beta-glucanase (GH16 family)